jgi:transcriptional regulator with XRE-family HTH domain
VSQLAKRLGATIRAKRKKAGLKQIHLAERVGVGANHICEIEKGKKYPSIDLLWYLEAELGRIWPASSRESTKEK